MKTSLYRATTRGHVDHGWLDTHHTFSFAEYYDPNRVHFGKLRVINDDIVVGGEGFGTHPHDNMEIISIPLYGTLEHKDSMGNIAVIQSGEVQVMSAGTGITHSEYNANADKPVNFFQIWVFPNQRDVKPRYQQQKFDFASVRNQFIQIFYPNENDDGLWIYQDAWFNMGTFDKGQTIEYKVKKAGNGIFVMVVEGEFTAGDQTLYHRDGMGIEDVAEIRLTANSDQARILIIEVPMQ
ncbi:MAG: pirin family protein [Bacteroidales bacterium]|jgi:redox-sensitive bicupin YhaK (pirin superfamily)|nr:pirin family protein [Bacteroidales bacterium]